MSRTDMKRAGIPDSVTQVVLKRLGVTRVGIRYATPGAPPLILWGIGENAKLLPGDIRIRRAS